MSERIAGEPQAALGYSSCAYLSFSVIPSRYAHSVQILKMCEALQAAGVRTTLHAVRPQGIPGSAQDVAIEYGLRSAPEIVWHRPAGKWSTRARMIRTAVAESKDKDLCFTRNAILASAAVLAGGRCVYEVHGPDLPRLDMALFGRVKHDPRLKVVAISSVLANMFAERHGLARESIHVEHDACETGATSELQRVRRPAGGPVRVGYVGSFYAGRGVDLILEMARRLPDVGFVLAGGSASDAGVDERSLPNVSFLGRVPHAEVERLLRGADILLMPYGRKVTVDGVGDSSRYCSPLKLFEYLAAGKAIVSTRTPSIEEVLVDGANARLLEAEDVDAWTATVAELSGDERLRDALGSAAAETAARHTWDKRVARILAAAS